jgi:DegV family protein with EDD domain
MIRIITDSTCEGPAEIMSNPAVDVVPLSVVFGQQALRDGVEITREQFWERLPSANPLPTTSQATPGDFLELFQRYTDAGDEIVVITLSSKLSGTYDSAVQAQQSLPGRPIDVVDSYSVSVGLALMVQEAIRLREAGLSRADMTARLWQMRDQIHILFALDTLEYLQRGGRIGRAQALVGTLLKFKPLLAIQGGEVVPAGRVRAWRKALEAMVEALAQEIPGRGPQVKIAVTQAGALEDARQVAGELAARFGTSQVSVNTLGPVVGVHTGPGVVGAAVYPGA